MKVNVLVMAVIVALVVIVVQMIGAPSARATTSSKFKIVCGDLSPGGNAMGVINEHLQSLGRLISVSAPSAAPEGHTVYGVVCVTAQYE